MALLSAHNALLKGIDLLGEDKTDTNLLGTYNTPFLTGYNQKYAEAWRRRGEMAEKSLTLDANKQFLLSALAYEPLEIVKVTQYQDYSANAGYGQATEYDWDLVGTSVVVYNADASTTVWVKYKPQPTPVVNPAPTTNGTGATSPTNITEQQELACIYGGMAEIRSTQGDPDMAKWEAKAFQILDGIRSPVRQKRIIDRNEY